MARYVALLRGFGPLHPNMRNNKLREVFIDLGFLNVQTVIASGNVIFESKKRDTKLLESVIENAFIEKLGFKSATIIRSEDQLRNLIKQDPFAGKKDLPESRLNVTFLKKGGEVFSIVDTRIYGNTPNVMLELEKQHGKDITTRTWKTVHRILNKMTGA